MKPVEAMHILASVITISLAFSLFKAEFFDPQYFLLILLTVGTGFVLHELGHRFAAKHYGAHAEYRAWTTGLFLALVLAFLTHGSFVFAAPGAVYIFGNVSRKQNGIISLAGPAMNFVLALFFLFLFFFTPVSPVSKELAVTGAYINTFLGLFNLIPFPPLDGSKIVAWNQSIWIASFLVFSAMFLFFML